MGSGEFSPTWQLLPILADCYTQDITTMDVYVSKIKNTKATGKLISALNTKFPNQNILHLKRVNSTKNVNGINELKIILTPNSDNLIDKIINYLNSEGLNDILDEPQIIKVPKCNPKTRKQFEKSMKLWPLTNFTHDKYIESVLNDTLFTNLEKQQLENTMKIALKAASKSKELGGKGTGTVITFQGKVLAIGCDARNLHPLKHSTMSAIDMIAWLRQSKSYPAPKWIGDEICEYNSDIVTSSTAYLCTDYDVFITREPCTMCAMALLHNRVKRIFYGCSNTNGALGTLFKLHTLPDINHRYEVFGGILSKECEEIISNDKIEGVNHDCFS